MSEKAEALGISKEHLFQALTLVRDLRHAALRGNLDPRATRIAILFAKLVDDYFAHKKLRPMELWQLQKIAQTLFEHARSTL